MTMNFPEISDELANIKKLINKFNIARRNLWRFKDTIKNVCIDEPTLVRYKNEKIFYPESRKEDTIARLRKKSQPYGKLELNEISLRAYSLIPIQEFCKRFKDDHNIVEDINEDVVEILENLKLEFPRLQKWDNTKLMTFLCEKESHQFK